MCAPLPACAPAPATRSVCEKAVGGAATALPPGPPPHDALSIRAPKLSRASGTNEWIDIGGVDLPFDWFDDVEPLEVDGHSRFRDGWEKHGREPRVPRNFVGDVGRARVHC